MAVTIADSGATLIFVMGGAKVINKRCMTCPLKVAFADGWQVVSTHMCIIHIDGFPFVLMGHIIPDLSIALLFGIRLLMEVGSNVTFDKHKCPMQYIGKIILSGDKDPSTDLWTLPLGSVDMTTHRVNDTIPSAAPVHAKAHAHLPTPIACFTTVRTKANSVRFAHQSLCSPCILTLLKAIRRGQLKGCPNMTTKEVTKYPNPSPAATKGHMKQPHQGIRSTRPKPSSSTPSPQVELPVLPIFQESREYPGPAYSAMHGNASSNSSAHCTANIIDNHNSPCKANLFCFVAFAGKQTGTLYNNLSGLFPFQSLEGNV